MKEQFFNFVKDNTVGIALALGSFALAIATLGYQYAISPVITQTALLGYYGFNSIEKRSALTYLLHQAGILKGKETLGNLFPDRKNKEDVLKDILNFIKATQSQFVLRTGFQERWEVAAAEWMNEGEADPSKREKIQGSFATVGLLKEIQPRIKAPDALCILGSTTESMKSRLAYANQLLQQGKIKPQHLFFLVGERKVFSMKDGKLAINTSADGEMAELKKIAKHYRIGLAKLTETHLMKWAFLSYQRSDAPLGRLKPYVIDTPAGDLPRPTTETTLMAFIQKLQKTPKLRAIKKASFVSNQPHVDYQDAVIKNVLALQGSSLICETIGPAADEGLRIKAAAGACGSAIFAKTPAILNALGIQKVKNLKLKEEFTELYKNNPLIYKQVQKL